MTDAPNPYDEWADLYDRVYAYLDHDIDFYLAQAQRFGGPVLEMGCGTGRIALELAIAGYDVVGIDASSRMIERATAKAQDQGLDRKTTFLVGDMVNARGGQEFGLVCFPFRSFQSLLTVEEQRLALNNVYSQLKPGGALVLDLFLPDFEQLADPHDAVVPFHVRDVPQDDGGQIVIYGQNVWEPVSQVNSTRLIIEELDPAGLMLARHYRDFDLRYTFRYEMEHLLELSGFELDATYGDFDGGEVTDATEDLVFVARKPGLTP